MFSEPLADLAAYTPGNQIQIRIPGPAGAEAASPDARKVTPMYATSTQYSDVLTLQEAASFLKCHPKTLRIMACKGLVPGARRIGRLWRFSLAKLKKWMDGE